MVELLVKDKVAGLDKASQLCVHAYGGVSWKEAQDEVPWTLDVVDEPVTKST
jgi:hypothetical protein